MYMDKNSNGLRQKSVLKPTDFEVSESDRVYFSLLEEMLTAKSPDDIAFIIILNKKKLDTRFFEIFDYKFRTEGETDIALGEELSYIDKIFRNLGVRKTMIDVSKTPKIEQKVKKSSLPESPKLQYAPGLVTNLEKCDELLALSPPKPKTVLIICKELLQYYPDNPDVYLMVAKAYDVLGDKEKAMKYRKKVRNTSS